MRCFLNALDGLRPVVKLFNADCERLRYNFYDIFLIADFQCNRL